MEKKVLIYLTNHEELDELETLVAKKPISGFCFVFVKNTEAANRQLSGRPDLILTDDEGFYDRLRKVWNIFLYLGKAATAKYIYNKFLKEM